MFLKENKVSNISFFAGAAIGLVGVFGEATILHNLLVNSYPFKMMGMPPANFYASIGNIGYYIAIAFGIISVILAVRLPRYLTSAVPVAVCPIVYWLVFEIAHLANGFSRDQMLERNFGGYTGNTARYEFGFEILVLLFFGTLIGLGLGATVAKISSVSGSKLD